MWSGLKLVALSLAVASAAAAQPCQPEWSALGPGLPHQETYPALAVFDDGTGPALYVGGAFTVEQGAPATGIARWDGKAWSSVGGGGVDGDYKGVAAFGVFDDGTGSALYIAGGFTSVAGVPALRAARWDGHAWTEVGGGLPQLRGMCFATFDDGAGEALYVGGWGGAQSLVYKLEDGGWQPVGEIGGFADRFNCSFVPYVRAMAVFDDGSGPALYAAGHFYYDTPELFVYSMARWDGLKWSEVGGPGPPGLTCIQGLAVFDAGEGAALYAGGWGGPISRWNGLAWTEVESYIDVGAMLVHDDGAGPALFVGGDFSFAGNVTANGIARWDGKTWSPLGAGLSRAGQGGDVYALSPGWDDPSIVFAYGIFDQAGEQLVANIARWGCPPCTADCDKTGALDFADWLCFNTLFAAADPTADCDASGSLDLFDFLCFVNAFNAGC